MTPFNAWYVKHFRHGDITMQQSCLEAYIAGLEAAIEIVEDGTHACGYDAFKCNDGSDQIRELIAAERK